MPTFMLGLVPCRGSLDCSDVCVGLPGHDCPGSGDPSKVLVVMRWTFGRDPKMPSGPPAHPALRWSSWNLLLLVPLLALITPLYNREEPRALGFPLFYWSQFLVAIQHARGGSDC
jgi:hypothetical protein